MRLHPLQRPALEDGLERAIGTATRIAEIHQLSEPEKVAQTGSGEKRQSGEGQREGGHGRSEGATAQETQSGTKQMRQGAIRKIVQKEGSGVRSVALRMQWRHWSGRVS